MEFKEYLEKIGGPKVLLQSMEQFRKDNIFFDKNRGEWLKMYPNQWVAVFREELIGADANLPNFLALVKVQNIPEPYSEVIQFLSTKNIPMILSCQAALS